MNKFKSRILSMDWGAILASAAAVAAGLVLLIFPGVSATVILCALGGALLIWGAVHTIRYFTQDPYAVMRGQDLTLGIVGLGAGALTLIYPEVPGAVLPTLLGFALLLGGIVKVQASLDLRRMGYSKWYLSLCGAAASVLLGVVVLANPFGTLIVFMRFIGAALIVEGALDVAALVLVRKIRKKFYPGR